MSDLCALVAAARGMLPSVVGLGWADPGWKHAVLPGEVLARAVPKRQREFSAGRAAARMALAMPDHALPMRPDRRPDWPAGFCGSISHSDSACLAIAAPLRLFCGLGIDLEPHLPLERDLWDSVLTAEEVSSLPAAAPGLTAKLIFAAKEASYKAQYPISEHLFGFDSVQIDLSEQTFTARFLVEVPGFAAGSELTGTWQRVGGHFLTLVTIPA